MQPRLGHAGWLLHTCYGHTERFSSSPRPLVIIACLVDSGVAFLFITRRDVGTVENANSPVTGKGCRDTTMRLGF